ncbi:hypothetical protein E0493_14190 [Roseomonas sp. M0104]|uniref:Uncharacterized protein n=1 Tax=Teichococcus coralli TaxID=2545983 RepID=A0A845BGM8_9PROT|nr:hypothetical protein [Pseudoroseomonas coralli]MXP64497.1 hypothetical protein [Pseudoroseomonas coralli]
MRRVMTAVMGSGVCAVALLGLYVAKRKLGIDVFPGRDMLPDAEIKAAVLGTLALLTFAPR